MAVSRWRLMAAPIIARVIAANHGKDERAVRAALLEAYPFGERAHHPYTMWCSEVRRQLATHCRKHADCLAAPEMGRECAARVAAANYEPKLLADLQQLNWLRANGEGVS